MKVFDEKVPINEDLKKGLIFKLGARLPTALIVRMTGYHHEVLPIM